MTHETLGLIIALCLPCLPLLMAALLFPGRTRSLALTCTPWVPCTALPLFLLHDQAVSLPWLLLGTQVGLDALSSPLLVLAVVAWTVAGWHARKTLDADRQHLFFLFWLLTWTGNLCVFITLDAASFYAAYAMMTFSAYGLIVFHQRQEDYRAGRVYLTMALMGEALLIGGLLLAGRELGNFQLGLGSEGIAALGRKELASWLFMVGFAVKVGIIPLHMWLPLAHPQAPVPASAVLSGVLLKAGVIGWLRFLPLENGGVELLGWVLLSAGMTTAFLGVMVGLCQREMKSLLAYSSVSQMGLIGSVVGAGLIMPDSGRMLAMTAVLMAVHHGLAKTALFLAIDGLKANSRRVWVLCFLPALSLAGAPFTSGALAKVTLKNHWPDVVTHLEWVLLLSSIATLILMARFLTISMPKNKSKISQPPRNHWTLLLLAGISLPWGVALIMGIDIGVPFQTNYFLETVGPILAGTVLSGLAWRYFPIGMRPMIPPGDVINLKPSVPKEVLYQPYRVMTRAKTLTLAKWSQLRLSIRREPVGQLFEWLNLQLADPGVASFIATLGLALLTVSYLFWA